MTEHNIEVEKARTVKKTGKGRPASPDTLVKGKKIGKAELSEDELKDISGGCAGGNHLTTV